MSKGGRKPQGGLEPRACAHCGTTFQPYRSHQIACSRPCREQTKGQNPRLKLHDFTCKRCGTPFQAMWSGMGHKPSCQACTDRLRREHLDRTNASRRAGGHLWETQTARQRKYNLRKYKISVEQFEAMHERQNGVCAICGEAPDPDAVRAMSNLHVDHDHATGRNRGLLCSNCNNGIGRFKDDPARLLAAARYLTEHAL